MSSRELWLTFCAVTLLVLATVLGYWCWSAHAFDTLLARAQFGDSFGFINAVFSGLAFAAVAAAIVVQAKQLSIHRDDLALTKRRLTAAFRPRLRATVSPRGTPRSLRIDIANGGGPLRELEVEGATLGTELRELTRDSQDAYVLLDGASEVDEKPGGQRSLLWRSDARIPFSLAGVDDLGTRHVFRFTYLGKSKREEGTVEPAGHDEDAMH